MGGVRERLTASNLLTCEMDHDTGVMTATAVWPPERGPVPYADGIEVDVFGQVLPGEIVAGEGSPHGLHTVTIRCPILRKDHP